MQDFIDKVMKHELKKLQQDTQTNWPEYCQGPPANLGSPGHGKLKADQWRTCIKFDIPISVAQLWSKETCPPEQKSEITVCHNKLFQSIMHLAVTVHWETSYKTSKHHLENFEKNMIACDVCWTSTLIFSFGQITILPSTLDPSSHNLDQHMVGGCFLLKELLGSCNESIQTANWISNGSRQDIERLLTKLHIGKLETMRHSVLMQILEHSYQVKVVPLPLRQ
jgi:hypothetical protein